MELLCKVQNYAWGVKGLKSSVASLIKSANPDTEIREELPYAELWMGTHPNGPSMIKDSNETLPSYIQCYPHTLGKNITEKFGNELCFLFKVLSVSQALSIQAHPEKSHAEKLHQQMPDVYKDPNHKPEMAIALTPFKALCGFRPSIEIQKFFKEFSELRMLVGEKNVSAFLESPTEENLKNCFSSMMKSPKEIVSSALENMARRLSSCDECNSTPLKDLFLTLLQQYPGDIGCFSIYLLNYIVLEPGEALFLGPNVIHAYLFGDCIECMACSDNVVRAGLTPKFQDVNTLLSMLDYEMKPAESRKFGSIRVNSFISFFNPPVPDFAVQMIKVNGEQEINMTKEDSASIMIVIRGNASSVSVSPPNVGEIKSPEAIKIGSVLFIQAGQILSFTAIDDFLGFRALC